MYLYHGTTASRARKALQDGIQPRALTGLSNWAEHPSCEQAVYLTNAYPVFFANVSASEADEDEAAFLVIDSDHLDPTLLAADEDAIEQAMRQMDDDPLRGMAMGERVAILRDQLLELVDNGFDWEWSLNALGNCTYHDTIPPEAIVKVVRWKRAGDMLFACDPTMTLMNFHIVGNYYRKMAAILAGVSHDVPESPFDMIYPEENIHALKSLVSVDANPAFPNL